MTKYIGVIIAWIIILGIALYIVRHYAYFLGGVSTAQDAINAGGVFDKYFK